MNRQPATITMFYVTVPLFVYAVASPQSSIHSAFVSPFPCNRRPATRCRGRFTYNRVTTKALHLSHHIENNLSELPLFQLLELLQQNDIRYAPQASRDELEALLRAHLLNNSSRTKNDRSAVKRNRSAAKITEVKDVVDAEVLSNRPIDQDEKRDYIDRQDVKRKHQYRNSYHEVRKSRRPRRDNSNYYEHERSSRYRDRRKNKFNHNRKDNIIDAVFDLPENSEDYTYDNGLQIFLMGFIEAGKTVAELTFDNANRTLPFSSEQRYDGDLDMMDVDMLDYRQLNDRRDMGSKSKQRHTKRKDITTSRKQKKRPELKYKNKTSVVPVISEKPSRRPQREIEPRTARQTTRSRNFAEDGYTKPIYGLEYASPVGRGTKQASEQPHRHDNHHKQRWRDRLRRKFDAALGLEQTSAPAEKESYYDSWKRNMRELDDSHKDRLRQKINTIPEVEAAKPQSRMSDTSTDSSVEIPQNRRARMRAAKIKIGNEPSSPSAAQSIVPSAKVPWTKTYKSKLRLKEKPLWKERGSIVSLLFDDASSSLKERVQFKKKRSLEVSCLSF